MTGTGHSRRREATLPSWPAQALHATLDLGGDPPPEQLPPLWHWLYFLDTAPRSRIGPDGHPEAGDFLPQVAQPRRMFAGATTRFLHPLQLERSAALTETVLDVQSKRGSQGEMTLVTVGFDYDQGGRRCIEEQRSYIYLPGAGPGVAQEAEAAPAADIAPAPWALNLAADEVLLFRFSALTFNAHRIHYDLFYARSAEGYPRLVVHAPLTAILLAQLMCRHARHRCASFRFRATAPLFAGDLLRLRGVPDDDGAVLTAYRPNGAAALRATAAWQ